MVRGWIPNFAILSILPIFIISHSYTLLYFIGLFLNSSNKNKISYWKKFMQQQPVASESMFLRSG